MRENAAKQVQNSKLVVLNLGSNDISLALTDIGPQKLQELLEQEEKSISVRGLIEGSKKVLEMGGSLTSLLVFVLDWAETVGALPETLAVYGSCMIEGVTKWMDVYPKLVARIYDLNKDCTIVNVGFYNAFKEMKLTDASLFNIGQLMEPASIEIQNRLNKIFKEAKIKLVYVCGMDHYIKCRYSFSKNVIAVDRKPYQSTIFKEEPKKLILFAKDENAEPYSSTCMPHTRTL